MLSSPPSSSTFTGSDIRNHPFIKLCRETWYIYEQRRKDPRTIRADLDALVNNFKTKSAVLLPKSAIRCEVLTQLIVELPAWVNCSLVLLDVITIQDLRRPLQVGPYRTLLIALLQLARQGFFTSYLYVLEAFDLGFTITDFFYQEDKQTKFIFAELAALSNKNDRIVDFLKKVNNIIGICALTRLHELERYPAEIQDFLFPIIITNPRFKHHSFGEKIIDNWMRQTKTKVISLLNELLLGNLHYGLLMQEITAAEYFQVLPNNYSICWMLAWLGQSLPPPYCNLLMKQFNEFVTLQDLRHTPNQELPTLWALLVQNPDVSLIRFLWKKYRTELRFTDMIYHHYTALESNIFYNLAAQNPEILLQILIHFEKDLTLIVQTPDILVIFLKQALKDSVLDQKNVGIWYQVLFILLAHPDAHISDWIQAKLFLHPLIDNSLIDLIGSLTFLWDMWAGTLSAKAMTTMRSLVESRCQLSRYNFKNLSATDFEEVLEIARKAQTQGYQGVFFEIGRALRDTQFFQAYQAFSQMTDVAMQKQAAQLLSPLPFLEAAKNCHNEDNPMLRAALWLILRSPKSEIKIIRLQEIASCWVTKGHLNTIKVKDFMPKAILAALSETAPLADCLALFSRIYQYQLKLMAISVENKKKITP